ncbi:MAG: Alkaline phosphatase synthesis transcriptional regulatory protein PhoP [Syntrophus sp. SKADARSKE-3]|nr:Alkaline phosphatase synthesis transcriptional regulatory protein PhoP [Syntrophus sp. SKADARSKE-3]
MPQKTILIVDDEKDIVELVGYNLQKEGLNILQAFDGEKALEIIRVKNPDLLILDLMLPGVKGLDVCRTIRGQAETAALPIIMLTAKSDDIDKIIGLEMGADDYITKPFSVRELVARVRSLLRRSELRNESEKHKTFSIRGLSIDYQSYEVTVNGHKANLGPTEMKLLIFLTKHPGRVYSRDQLLDQVWGGESFVEPRTVDVHISRLRTSIEKDKDNPEYILTVRGIGYKFTDAK